jgi:hypothetical protein
MAARTRTDARLTGHADPPTRSAQADTPADACRAGRWRCRVGWLVYLLVAAAVVIAFGAGA